MRLPYTTPSGKNSRKFEGPSELVIFLLSHVKRFIRDDRIFAATE